ncbi:MAG: VOC family protein, partial [Caulobacter sp.]|nr:VOC family protein [Caulobacter sp.]
GYIELLGITRPDAEMDPGMQADQASLHGGAGSRTFGLHSAGLDQAQAAMKAQGLPVTPIFTAPTNDPDGQGLGKPPRWRLFAFEKPVLASNLFFIDYAAPRADPASVADDKAARQHPNGTKSLSAVWLLSADAAADKAGLEKLGVTGAVPVKVPQVGAKGYCVAVGPNALLTLQPDGPGVAADALREGGPQVLAVSLGVADLDVAKRRVERGYEQSLEGYQGVSGASFLAPTRADLGMLIEFHAQTGKG